MGVVDGAETMLGCAGLGDAAASRAVSSLVSRVSRVAMSPAAVERSPVLERALMTRVLGVRLRLGLGL